MFNKVVMIGNLTRDVELRYLPNSGSAIATIGLACNRRFKRQDGSMGDETCFIDVKFIGRTAEVVNQYLRKGSKVLVEGRLVYETWTDQTGAKKSRHSIMGENMQMLDTRQDTQNSQNYEQYNTSASQQAALQNNYQTPQQNTYQPQQQAYSETYTQNIPEINIDDDEIPF
ncbi:single-stranded DNA-binding protein [Helicobacter cholecystus]|uniref:Single-stranded DNA-binding protein n=1 Tax=Helicobacter cholecystus TaxID=45498 RepID=A0A3D8IXN2_9HELI|nr:single-stranded DNA-binding protein [Helicobacter cholecystus]RDU70022.1 single-stranded DNA-binding protein [Helicobacter cholecystus]VEJ24809.1 single-stranded DNA-binding protein [Helicobacter cholecystus]